MEYEVNRYFESLGDDAPFDHVQEMFDSGRLAPFVQALRPFLRGDIPPEEDELFLQFLQRRTAVEAAVLGVMDAAAVDAMVYPTAVQTAPPVGDPGVGGPGGDDCVRLWRPAGRQSCQRIYR